ncbi:carbamoyltransferase family protein [Desulfobacter latus]|uniref:Carbamoyltransferase n=1 Tax=Desulfobacter latus TaxID=2292 RepID=A0A850TC68_9BACT|nr:carbamoyltransferase C-terminal domain-containing protein [Desulfobacter latus]NWH04976.1 carbamoyltransferase [Desulfobacter latus]
MKILGINHDMYISSAVLMENGKIAAGGAEERFIREKQTRNFPSHAIEFCLKKSGNIIKDIDYITSSWNPGVYLKNYNPLFSDKRRWKAEHLFSVPDNIFKLFDEKTKNSIDHVEQTIFMDNTCCRLVYVTHHLAHAANGFFPSPFETAAILTADAQGELEATTFCLGKGNKINKIKSIDYPQSMGAFYSTITEYLGFRPNSDEWKVMALAGFHKGGDEYYKKFKENLFSLQPDGEYEFDLTYFQGYNHEQPHLFTEKLVRLLGPAHSPRAPVEDRHYAIAAALQQSSEEIAVHMLNWLYKETQCKSLCLSGGFFMNSVFNGRVLSLTPFEDLFISPCPDDSGNSIGAALYLHHHILGNTKRHALTHNFFGPEYSDREIESVINKFGIRYRVEQNIEKACAEFIAEGKLVGWFQGRMEFGQRALGNRSILADPRDPSTKDKVNMAVKFRESFRPFAPAVLEEDAKDYFKFGPNSSVPFMEKVYMIPEDKRAQIPAVTHVDGSGRLQTVSKAANPRFHKMICEFKALTGLPIVLNTSFNLNGEAIVCTPEDALRTFFSCGLDILIMGQHIITKG